jgi:hypothetical protein
VYRPYALVLAVVLATSEASSRAAPTLDEVIAGGSEWRFETARGALRVWIPDGYDAKTAATVIFVHGYRTRLDGAWRDGQLVAQFALSGVNAMFIGAEAPSGPAAAVVWPSPTSLLAAVTARSDVAVPTQQRLVVIGHSGAYRTLSAWLTDDRLDTLVMLDAMYGDHGFTSWLNAAPHHRLINIASETARASDRMHRQLPATTYVDGLTAASLPEGKVVYARTHVGHWQLLNDGIALPIALRSIDVARLGAAPDLSLGVPKKQYPFARR